MTGLPHLAGLKDCIFGDDAGYIPGGGDIKCRIAGTRAGRSHPLAANKEDFFFIPLLDGNMVAGRAPQINGRTRGSNIKGDAVFFGEHRFFIGTDFVGDIAVSGDSVGTDDAEIDFAASHVKAGSVIGDDFVRDSFLEEFPTCQMCTLTTRSGFIYPDEHVPFLPVREVNRRGGAAPIDDGEPASVTMGENASAAFE